jgi:hypothetical protein
LSGELGGGEEVSGEGGAEDGGAGQAALENSAGDGQLGAGLVMVAFFLGGEVIVLIGGVIPTNLSAWGRCEGRRKCASALFGNFTPMWE